MKTLNIYIAVITFAMTIISCKPHICSDASSYSFMLNASIIPDKDSIHIGDTLWLQSNNPTTLQDRLSGNNIDYSGSQNLGTLVTIIRFQSGTNTEGSINNFNLNVIKGTELNTSSDPSSNRSFLFQEENKTFKFNLIIIPKDTGRFVLTISDAPSVYRKNDVCTKAAFEIDFQNTNQHFYLLELWRPDLILDALGKLKVYYFKVY